MENLLKIKEEARIAVAASTSAKELESIYRLYLGRKGKVSQLINKIQALSLSERKKLGREINDLKEELQKLFTEKEGEMSEGREGGPALPGGGQGGKESWIDVTAPGKRVTRGHLHPLTHVFFDVEDIFASLGFSVADGPEIEDEWHNFDALNIPAYHPARDMWDTFWLKPLTDYRPQTTAKKEKAVARSPLAVDRLLLRTHTSPVQVRYMEKQSPPLRIIAPGKAFRHEATDAAHGFQFYQLEGLMVQERISIANFKAVIGEFFRKFFGRPVEIRLRPSFFPFVEPGFEVDLTCVICSGSGKKGKETCSVCKGTGWIEIMGAGMVHPKVFEAVQYDTSRWRGVAFGMGLDRLTMIKYKIDDIRLLHEGDMKFLEQF